MVYLGACYAAGGKDREAASAWQTALLRERDSRVLQRLAIEAWLRADRAAAAQALVKQARQRWPDDPSFVALAAQVALADGRRQEGLELVATLADPGDLLLLQALAALYEAAQEGQPIWDADRDLARMRALREAYAKANGESLGLVDAWIAGVASNQP
jgi:predicted Zn-dependent protease